MKVTGKVIKYGDNIDTDVIIPARYLNCADERELAAHCMEDLDSSFVKRVKAGDILVAGKNFGCGSSREHAPLSIRASGIACVVAADFARIFYRNAINIGLPIIECPEIYEECTEGDTLKIDFDTGEIVNKTKNKRYKTFPFPPFLQEIISNRGLMNTLRSEKEKGYEV